MAGGVYSYFNGYHHRLWKRPEIPIGYLRPNTQIHTLSYPHVHMHTLVHMHANKRLYRQNLDFVGSKAEKLTLVTGFGNRGLWGAKTSSRLWVSSASGKPL